MLVGLALLGTALVGPFSDEGQTGSRTAVSLNTSWRQSGNAFDYELGLDTDLNTSGSADLAVIVEEGSNGTIALDWVIDHDSQGAVYQQGVWDETTRESVDQNGTYTHFWVNGSDVERGQVRLMDDTFHLDATTSTTYVFTDGVRTFEYDRDTGMLVSGSTDLLTPVLDLADQHDAQPPDAEPRTNEVLQYVDDTNLTTVNDEEKQVNVSKTNLPGTTFGSSSDQKIRVWCTVQAAENTLGQRDTCTANYEMTEDGVIVNEERQIQWPEFTTGEFDIDWVDANDGQTYFEYFCNPEGLVYDNVDALENGCTDENADKNSPDPGTHRMEAVAEFGEDDDVCLNAEAFFNCEIEVASVLSGPVGCGSADNDQCEVVS